MAKNNEKDQVTDSKSRAVKNSGQEPESNRTDMLVSMFVDKPNYAEQGEQSLFGSVSPVGQGGVQSQMNAQNAMMQQGQAGAQGSGAGQKKQASMGNIMIEAFREKISSQEGAESLKDILMRVVTRMNGKGGRVICGYHGKPATLPERSLGSGASELSNKVLTKEIPNIRRNLSS